MLPPSLLDAAERALAQVTDQIASEWEAGSPPDLETLTLWVDVLSRVTEPPAWLVTYTLARARAEIGYTVSTERARPAPLIVSGFDFDSAINMNPRSKSLRVPSWSEPARRNDALIKLVLERAPDWFDRDFRSHLIHDPHGTCVLWAGAVDSSGYGVVSLPTEIVQRADGSAITVRAARVMAVAQRGLDALPRDHNGHSYVHDHYCGDGHNRRCVTHAAPASMGAINREVRRWKQSRGGDGS